MIKTQKELALHIIDNRRFYFNYLKKRTRDTESTKDQLQDAICNLLNNGSKEREVKEMKMYCIGILSNLSRQKYRKDKYHKLLGDKYREDIHIDWPHSCASPEDLALVYERNEKLKEAVKSLPNKQRTVITEDYFNDKNVEEIAEIIGTKSKDTVNSHRKWGRANLMIKLMEYYKGVVNDNQRSIYHRQWEVYRKIKKPRPDAGS